MEKRYKGSYDGTEKRLQLKVYTLITSCSKVTIAIKRLAKARNNTRLGPML